ncbi:MAG: TRAP transporter small permease [Geobacter sp.]|nr:TRAP transporter small permease [Geobacter sp.]
MNKYLDHLEEIIITFLIGAATIIIFVAVAHRYLSGLPIPGMQDRLLSINMSWAQELCIYMFVWMAKFGAAYGVRTGIHVGVDVLVNRLPDTWRKKCVMLAITGGALFTGIIGTLGVKFVWENGLHYAAFSKLGMNVTDLIEGPITPDLEWPTWIIYSAVPLGSFLMSFRFVQTGWVFFRTGELPRHDHTHVEGVEEEKVVDDTEALEEFETHKFEKPAMDGGAK